MGGCWMPSARPPARLPSIRIWCAVQIVQLLALDVVCDSFDEIDEIEEHVHKCETIQHEHQATSIQWGRVRPSGHGSRIIWLAGSEMRHSTLTWPFVNSIIMIVTYLDI